MDADSNLQQKLNSYSLKYANANQKFDEAFALQKDYKKAVNKMKYEFDAPLSIHHKRLLDKEWL